MDKGFIPLDEILESLLFNGDWTVTLKAKGERIVCTLLPPLKRGGQVFTGEGEDLRSAVDVARDKSLKESK